MSLKFDKKPVLRVWHKLSGLALISCLVFSGINTVSPVHAGVLDEISAMNQGQANVSLSSESTDQGFSFYSEFTEFSQISQISQISVADHASVGSGYTVQLSQSVNDGSGDNDPFEGFNRAMFSFNQEFYDIVLGPLSDVYNILPAHARSMIGGVLSNLSSPLIFINDVLQGEPVRAFDTARRFMVNTIFGFGGIADVATSFGIEEHDEDFGQTLAVWGAGEGFYLVLPILGPSNPRDAIGRFLVDPWIDPVGIYLDNHGDDDWIYVRYGVNAVHDFSIIKEELKQLENVSVDYYAAVRSLYRQKRNVAISNGDEMDLPSIPDFEFGDFQQDPFSDPDLGSVDQATEET